MKERIQKGGGFLHLDVLFNSFLWQSSAQLFPPFYILPIMAKFSLFHKDRSQRPWLDTIPPILGFQIALVHLIPTQSPQTIIIVYIMYMLTTSTLRAEIVASTFLYYTV